MDAMTIGIDLAKDVFEVAISQHSGRVASRRRLSRRQFAKFVESLGPQMTVVMETCATAHYWGRRCAARGATVRLLPAQYVQAYGRRDKTDRADAEALLEAHRCGGIHAVPLKTAEQQAWQGLHRVRQQWQSTRTARINLLRSLLLEQGIVIPRGARTAHRQLRTILAAPAHPVPAWLRSTLVAGLAEIHALEDAVAALDRELSQLARQHPVAQRLQQIPGIGGITATALVASVPHIHAFRRGRHFASWLGLTPREFSSGHRRSLGHISKRGNPSLRCFLVPGARAVLRVAELRVRTHVPATRFQQWAAATAARRGRNRAAIAVANKTARIIWAMWTRDTDFAATSQRPTTGGTRLQQCVATNVMAFRSDRH